MSNEDPYFGEDPYARIYRLEQEIKRLQRKIDAGPKRNWLETDDPDVVACMGSVPACQARGCQLRVVLRTIQNIDTPVASEGA